MDTVETTSLCRHAANQTNKTCNKGRATATAVERRNWWRRSSKGIFAILQSWNLSPALLVRFIPVDVAANGRGPRPMSQERTFVKWMSMAVQAVRVFISAVKLDILIWGSWRFQPRLSLQHFQLFKYYAFLIFFPKSKRFIPLLQHIQTHLIQYTWMIFFC